jgi:hypothetical protein
MQPNAYVESECDTGPHFAAEKCQKNVILFLQLFLSISGQDPMPLAAG